jgi:hypothetical protein
MQVFTKRINVQKNANCAKTYVAQFNEEHKPKIIYVRRLAAAFEED